MAAGATVTEAQIVAIVVIGSVMSLLVIANFIMCFIYKKASNMSPIKTSQETQKRTDESKSSGEYESISFSSRYRVIRSNPSIHISRSSSASRYHSTSVPDFSSLGQASWIRDRSGESSSVQEVSFHLDSSADTSASNQPELIKSLPASERRKRLRSRCSKCNPESLGKIKTTADIHSSSVFEDRSLSVTGGLSEIHRHQARKLKLGYGISKENAAFYDKDNKTKNNLTSASDKEAYARQKHSQYKQTGYVDLMDFENDTDTDILCICSMSEVRFQTSVYQPNRPLQLMHPPVVEFQNKAFEFSETKTSLEEVTDTEL